jgi:DNA repair protein RecO (recombination protein O)
MHVNTTGIILRETAYKESSKILTVLTSSHGKLTVSARGALRKNSKLAAVTQLLAYSEMTLFCNRGRWTLNEARSVQQFIGLRRDLPLIALGAYIAEIVEAVADEDSPNAELLPLCLNALYALSEGLKHPAYVKPAVELRLMAAAGYTPLISSCSICSKTEFNRAYLDKVGGTLRCELCPSDDSEKPSPLSPGALQAARYIISCDSKKLFSFTIGEKALNELTSACEGYLLCQLDRRFGTLDFYNRVKDSA